MGMSPDTAKPDALIALYRAAQTFDAERGVSFGSFARTCITNRLTDLIRADKNEFCRHFDFDVERIAVGDGILARLERAEERAAFHAVARECLSEYEYRILLLWLSLDKTSLIAKELDSSAKSVDNAKSRILKKLRLAFGVSKK
jgi:RNA polymerase sporulation-specific sigma factor